MENVFQTGMVKTIFEVGCGVGNFMFPLLEEDANLFFYACDFSPRAVQFVKVRNQKKNVSEDVSFQLYYLVAGVDVNETD